MDSTFVFGLVIAAIIMLAGIYQLVTGRILGSQDKYNKRNHMYTEASLLKANRVSGLLIMLLGLTYGLFKLARNGNIAVDVSSTFWLILLIVFIVLLVISNSLILKKKDV